MKTLYPNIIPFNTFLLDTSSAHKVYVEQSGNPKGIPVIFLHGGPCSGTKPEHRCFFNPDLYHIILMDQRGCGQSIPFGELQNNSTQDLIADMESIRKQLNITQWLLFGGSWGGTLALLYAQQHPEYVSGMILRGVFLARQTDMEWFAKVGVNKIYPEQWQRLVSCLPQKLRNNLIQGLHTTIWSDDELAQRRIAIEWSAWNAQVALGSTFRIRTEARHASESMLKQARMELHYAKHNYFIAENQIIEHCSALQHIPTLIIHGRYDLVCPIEAAISLHQALPQAKFIALPNAGHIAQGDEMIDALVSATDNMASLLA